MSEKHIDRCRPHGAPIPCSFCAEPKIGKVNEELITTLRQGIEDDQKSLITQARKDLEEAAQKHGFDLPRTKEADPVNHPKHYTSHPSGIECIQVTEHMNFNVGNAMKYLWRCDEKGNHLQDLQKAAWYIQREIARRSK